MEIEVTGSSNNESFAIEVGGMKRKVVEEKDQVRVTRKTLQAVLEQCQRAIESISNSEGGIDDEDEKDDVDPQGEASGVGLQRDQEVDEVLFCSFCLLYALGFCLGAKGRRGILIEKTYIITFLAGGNNWF